MYKLVFYFVLNICCVFQLWPPGIHCQLCHMAFEDQSAINAHYDTAHGDTARARRGEGTYECELCGKKLSEKRWLKHHMATMHGVGDVKTFQCDICSHVFNHKGNLSVHMKRVHKVT